MSEAKSPSLQSVLRSLEWVDNVTWDLTGLPDAFLGLLSHCSDICRDRANIATHFNAANELLGITDNTKSSYDAEGPDALKAAIRLSAEDTEFSANLASLCDTYYFLRSLDGFALDEQSFGKLVSLLRLEEPEGEGKSVAINTHQEVRDSLDAYLEELESEYPGIKQHVDRVMLEANIVQEFDADYEQLFSLRSKLPSDSTLYLDTLRCILEGAQKNMNGSQIISEAHRLYQDSNSEYWSVACGAIWELEHGRDGDVDIEALECDDGERLGKYTDAASKWSVGVTAS
ncbi:hypothetical protein GGI07_001633 [Coemansia sp. Benny D115]|nr:hypothetical protein GGI07_001633 [Coemansia sp. Benny D115]